METTTLQTPLSNLQLELLTLFAQNVPEEDLIAIQRLIAQYFAEKATAAADKLWDERGWTIEDEERLLNTRMRTPYNPHNE